MNSVKGLGKVTNRLLKNKNVSLVLSLLIAMYAGLAAPALPNAIVRAADSTLGKLFFLFLIAYAASRNIQVALMVAVAFVLTLHIANQRATEFYINRVERFTPEESCTNSGGSWNGSACDTFNGDQPNYSAATTEPACDELGGNWNKDDGVCEAFTDAEEDASTAATPSSAPVVTPYANYEGFWANADGGDTAAEGVNSVADHAHSLVGGGNVDPESVGAQVPAPKEEEKTDKSTFTNFIGKIMNKSKEDFSVYPNSGAKYAYSLF